MVDWVTGLYLFGTSATLATFGWVFTRLMPACWGKIDIRPILMWFKMVATIFWLTFFGLLGLHFLMGG